MARKATTITPRRRRVAPAIASVVPLAISMIPSAQQLVPESKPTSAIKAAQGCGVHCGTERWSIKTMSDAGANSVVMTPFPSTVSSLVSSPAPDQSSDTERLNNLEKQAFTVRARLVGFKEEFDGKKGDRDFHIVIKDLKTDDTMIVEIPDPECSGVCNSVARDQITRARDDFLAAFPDTPPGRSFLVLDDPQPEVEVTGVGLFDFFHGQTGVATNCLELHPVLNIAFRTAGPFQARSDPKRQPKATDASDHNCIPQ